MNMLKLFLSFSFLFCFLIATGWSQELKDYYAPMSNPVYHWDARSSTFVRPVFLYQQLPDKVEFRKDVKALLKDLGIYDTARKLDGDIYGVALQFSYAVNNRLSLVAVKSGYISCDPDDDSLIDDGNGFADLAAGFQYSFLYQPKNNFVASLRAVVELTNGDDHIYQGNGDGNLNLGLLFLKGFNKLQFSGAIGVVIPFDRDEEDAIFYDSWHLGYNVTPRFHPFLELNHFYTLASGDRDLNDVTYLGQPLDQVINAVVSDPGLTKTEKAEILAGALRDLLHSSQKDDVVAAVASFSGCDLVNLGGAHSTENESWVSLALGFRYRLMKWLTVGTSYEFLLTDEEETLMNNRLLVDAIISFSF